MNNNSKKKTGQQDNTQENTPRQISDIGELHSLLTSRLPGMRVHVRLGEDGQPQDTELRADLPRFHGGKVGVRIRFNAVGRLQVEISNNVLLSDQGADLLAGAIQGLDVDHIDLTKASAWPVMQALAGRGWSVRQRFGADHPHAQRFLLLMPQAFGDAVNLTPGLLEHYRNLVGESIKTAQEKTEQIVEDIDPQSELASVITALIASQSLIGEASCSLLPECHMAWTEAAFAHDIPELLIEHAHQHAGSAREGAEVILAVINRCNQLQGQANQASEVITRSAREAIGSLIDEIKEEILAAQEHDPETRFITPAPAEHKAHSSIADLHI